MLAAQGNVKGEAPMLRLRSAVTALMIGACLAGSSAVTVASPLPDDPPFTGTAYIDADIITSSDPTALESITANGQGSRVMYDRRVPDFITVNAWLFNATFEDGLTAEVQVNPEFDAEQAFDHAFKYAVEIGRLPTASRADVQKVWIHDGDQDFGGGNNSILIHVGRTASYEAGGFLEEILMHESSHTSLDADHAAAAGWLAAQDDDPTFISEYARDNPTREDVAESFVPWFAVRFRATRIGPALVTQIENAIPNRIDYLDGLGIVPYGDPAFSDVPYAHPFYNEIAWMKEEDISTGFGDGTYRPSIAVARQAMSAFMYRLAGATEPACTPSDPAPFTDVPNTHPFCKEIRWMKTSGISTGFGDGTYRPSIAVTRQAMSAFMYRLAGASAPACGVTAPFSDVPTDHPFCREIKWMKDQNISTGFGDGTYRPSIAVTRQAMSAFMYRVSLLLP
jgi:hypothetical protein